MSEIDHNSIVELRHELHAMAEVSGEEHSTSSYLRSYLAEHAEGRAIQVTATGFVWVVDTGKPGPKVMFRAELDALPISELNEFSYKSKNMSVAHMCGHDGHMAILVGTIVALSSDLPESGIYYFLFQPAEETGQGAAEVLANEKFSFEPDFIFALHNLPGFPIGEVICKTESLNAAVTSVVISFMGKTSHASEPEKGVNPALAIAKILLFVESDQNSNMQSDEFSLMTPVHIVMGEQAYGVSAGYGEVHFTLRAWSNKELEKLKRRLLAEVNQLAEHHGLSVSVDWLESFASTHNDQKAVELIQKASSIANLQYVTADRPFKWGEDFGLFTDKFKGGFFGLGAGEDIPALHNPDYDFPDLIIPIGVKMFTNLILLNIEEYRER